MKNNFFRPNNMFWNAFKTNLENDKIPEHSILRLEKKIEKISNYVNDKNKNILIVGHIQSGKTNSFIGLISRIFDHDIKCQLAFLLAGQDNKIYEQNLERIMSNFGNNSVVNRYVKIYEKNIKNENEIVNNILEQLQRDKKIVIVCNKNLQTMGKWLTIFERIKDQITSSVIVDDEGDIFSQNNDHKFKINNERTPINNMICQLKNILIDKTTYITITATPYANLIEKHDNILKPDYCFLIEKGMGYTGIDFFLQNELPYRKSPILNIIPQTDIKEFYECGILSTNFKNAILQYIVFSLIFNKHSSMRNWKIDKAKMLINPGIKNFTHDKVEDQLNYFLDEIKSELNSNNIELIKKIVIFKDEYINYVNFEEKNDVKIEISDEDILAEIKEVLQDQKACISIIKINKDNNKKSKTFDKNIETDLTFLIGCKKLSRGVTIASLIMTYIFYRAEKKGNSDTISQTQRWLGYRDNYKFFLTLYCSNELVKDFNSIIVTNEDLYAKIKYFDENEIDISKCKFKFTLDREDKRLKTTRSTVAKEKITENYCAKNAENTPYFIDHKWCNGLTDKTQSECVKEIWEILNESINEDKIQEISLKTLLKDITNTKDYTSFFFKNLNDFKISISYGKFSKLNECLGIDKNTFEELVKKNENKKLVISYLENRGNNGEHWNRHRTWCDDKITTIPAGTAENYAGDRYWFKMLKENLNKNDYLFIQIFPIDIIFQDEIICIHKIAFLQYLQDLESAEKRDNQYFIEGVEE